MSGANEVNEANGANGANEWGKSIRGHTKQQ
jgi:hypothetical protein